MGDCQLSEDNLVTKTGICRNFNFGMIGKNHQMIQGYKDERI
jgi:hypothetical protein